MSWSDMKIDATGKFLKVEGGSYSDVHILNEHPKKELVHGGGKDKTSCIGEGCDLCDNPDTPKEMRKQERWKTNILDRKDKQVKIWEFGSGVASQIKEIAKMLEESGQTVHSVDFRISATGSGQSKRYTIMQKPQSGPIPPGIKLHEL